MKPMKRHQAVSLIEQAGFVLKVSGPHKRYECPITGLIVHIPHDREVSPAMMRDIYKGIKKAQQLRNAIPSNIKEA